MSKSGQGVMHSLQEFLYFRGRVALYAILKGLGIGDGAEVATQAFTCVAVPEGIMAAGAKPVWVDIESNGYNMDPDDLVRKITPRTQAIIVQHTYGIPANMDSIMAVARQADIPIIEDCCHTLTSTYKGKQVGTFGVGSFYSFEWGKPIVVGVGGSALVNKEALRQRIENAYINYDFPSWANRFQIQLQYLAFRILFRPSFYWPVRSLFHWLGSLGVAESNYNPVGEADVAKDFTLKMPKPLQRRLARKLQDLDQQTDHAQWVAEQYRAKIESKVVSHPILPENGDTVFARYPLLAMNKSSLLEAARAANVELAEWYTTPVHPLSDDELSLVDYTPGDCPNAEARCQAVVTLPTHRAVKERDIDRTVRFLNEVRL